MTLAIAIAAYAVVGWAPPLRWPPMVRIAVAAAAIAALFVSSGRPTGWRPADWFWRMVVAGLAAACGARARSFVTTGVAAATIAILLFVESGVTVLAGVALGAALARQFVLGRESRASAAAGAIAGGAAALVALDLHTARMEFLPSLLALVVIAPLLIAGLLGLPPRHRRRAGAMVAAVAGIAVLLSALSALAILRSRNALEAAVDDARAGLDAAQRASDREVAAARLASAEANFDRAHSNLSAFWARGGRVVPVAGNHVTAVRDLSMSGAALSAAARDTLGAVNSSRLRPVGGEIDLGALAEANVALGRARFALEGALRTARRTDSPWLAAPLERRRAEFERELEDARQPVADAADGATVALRLLGSPTPQKFLVVMMSNAESRSVGGFPGSYAIISAHDGKLQLERVGRASGEFAPRQDLQLNVAQEFKDRYEFNGYRTVGTLVLTPDFPTAAQLFVEALPQMIGESVSGVIGIDPYALAAMLRLTGPISVPTWPVPIDERNVTSILLHEQYVELGGARGDFQGDVVRQVYEKLSGGAVPSPSALVEALGPAVRGRRLQLYSTDRFVQDFFVRTGSAGAITTPEGDSFGIFNQNLVGNKIDWFLQRRVDLDVDYDPSTGSVRTRAKITLTNRAPTAGLPPGVIASDNDAQRTVPGLNRSWFNIYTTQKIERATIDGRPLELAEQTELNRRVYWTELLLGAGTTTTIELTLASQTGAGAPWSLEVLRQPFVGTDALSVTVSPAAGWELRSTGPTGLPVRQEQDRNVQIEITPKRT